ncbi:phosphoglycolate phosphatase [Burkholderia sp. WAC0059]|uniref:phosphoglycolate phosphatase n=1 Tax=Burkholderia sp. WAC0059 TaxID=2066022 RepID=UPI000C7F12AA|nr:phosphoglycolate phosphatase [Burkholderia sp. WAC0059]PLZ01852.1 phosphoglycolate phosphatase [Burkholderia sp. WAC0059]
MTQTTTLPSLEGDDDAALDVCDAVLFDLDGTLADTAPDLAAAANRMRRDRNLTALPLDQLRPVASAGARGMLGRAFGIAPDNEAFAAMRDEFLANYEASLCVETALFPGIGALLDELDARGVRWGIVTNKAARFTDPLVALLKLDSRAGCVVSGDTTPHSKPHPAPLLHAAQAIGIDPRRAVYVGDDLRDVQAGQAAGMVTIAAAYGYCGSDLAPENWNAQYLAGSTAKLRSLLEPVGTSTTGRVAS